MSPLGSIKSYTVSHQVVLHLVNRSSIFSSKRCTWFPWWSLEHHQQRLIGNLFHQTRASFYLAISRAVVRNLNLHWIVDPTKKSRMQHNQALLICRNGNLWYVGHASRCTSPYLNSKVWDRCFGLRNLIGFVDTDRVTTIDAYFGGLENFRPQVDDSR